MELNFPGIYASIILAVAFLVAFILFLVTQQQILKLIEPEQRRMPPGQVWLQLVPLFGLVWQFIVIARLSKSIHNQLTFSSGDSIFDAREKIPDKPTYVSGITYAVVMCATVIPLPFGKTIIAAVALGNWVNYWIDLNRYRKKLKTVQTD